MVIEEEFHPCSDISEDVKAEENDYEEGAEMSTTVHDESFNRTPR